MHIMDLDLRRSNYEADGSRLKGSGGLLYNWVSGPV